MISKILVPTDGSKAAQKAALFAVDLAKQLKASISALCVIDKRMFVAKTVPAAKAPRHTPETIEDYLNEAAQKYVDAVKTLCDERHVEYRVAIKMGYPVDEIVKEAKRAKANLIVMGSRGRSALSATVMGSVSYGVVHHAQNVPVLVVK